jgi:2,3-dihydroxybenzoate-AMP ligase
VVLKAGCNLSLNELTDFLKAKEIARFKLPERLEVFADFPVSTFGKVSKKALAEMIAQK